MSQDPKQQQTPGHTKRVDWGAGPGDLFDNQGCHLLLSSQPASTCRWSVPGWGVLLAHELRAWLMMLLQHFRETLVIKTPAVGVELKRKHGKAG